MAEYCQSNVIDRSVTSHWWYLHANCHFRSKNQPHFIPIGILWFSSMFNFSGENSNLCKKEKLLYLRNGNNIHLCEAWMECKIHSVLNIYTSNCFKFIQHATHNTIISIFILLYTFFSHQEGLLYLCFNSKVVVFFLFQHYLISMLTRKHTFTRDNRKNRH